MNDTPTFKSFNPTPNPHVDEIKKRTDELIEYVKTNAPASPEARRRVAIAATNYEQAAMWAVKSIFS